MSHYLLPLSGRHQVQRERDLTWGWQDGIEVQVSIDENSFRKVTRTVSRLLSRSETPVGHAALPNLGSNQRVIGTLDSVSVIQETWSQRHRRYNFIFVSRRLQQNSWSTLYTFHGSAEWVKSEWLTTGNRLWIGRSDRSLPWRLQIKSSEYLIYQNLLRNLKRLGMRGVYIVWIWEFGTGNWPYRSL